MKCFHPGGCRQPTDRGCSAMSRATCQQIARSTVVCRAKAKQAYVAVPPTRPTSAASEASSHTPLAVYLAPAAAVAGAVGLLWALLARNGCCTKLPERPEPLPSPSDPGYKMALARSRMSAHVHAAAAYMRTGDPARCMVELGRALHENELSRSPLLDGHCSRAELLDLYRLFIKHSETVPPPFSALLQMRTMLGLDPRDADAVEAEVVHTSAVFEI